MVNSTELRDVIIQRNRQNIKTEAEQYRKDIVNRTQHIMEEVQHSHDQEIHERFKKELDKAYTSIIDKYAEIMTLRGTEGNTDLENIDINRRLNRQIKHFRKFINNHLVRISLYGEVPKEFLEICNNLELDINK